MASLIHTVWRPPKHIFVKYSTFSPIPTPSSPHFFKSFSAFLCNLTYDTDALRQMNVCLA